MNAFPLNHKSVKAVGRVPGVYYLYDSGGLKYIGYSKSLYSRLRRYSPAIYSEFGYTECASAIEAKRLESEEIAKHQPPHNCIGVKGRFISNTENNRAKQVGIPSVDVFASGVKELERLSNANSALIARMDDVLSKIEFLFQTEARPMTVKEFASRVGVDRKTIYTRIRAGQIVRKLGRVPHSELAKYGIK